jgi:hypothetical protein
MERYWIGNIAFEQENAKNAGGLAGTLGVFEIISRKGAKAQRKDARVQFSSLRLCVRLLSNSSE